ncbi:aldehyde dehydrogenase family protein [Virgisporangium aurantiacum]
MAARLCSVHPVTGDLVGEYDIADPADVATAVDRAQAGAEWWAGLGFAGRRHRLLAWKRLLARRIDDLADVVRAETGKPKSDAVLEVMLAVEHLDWAGRNARPVLRRRRVGSGILAANLAATLEYKPLGVVGVIGPWTSPSYTPMGSISYPPPAGNAVVFKPSEFTPAVGVWLAERWREAVPEHPVLQVVTGDGRTGAALCVAGVDKLAFTGSTATGKRVMAACAQTLTPVVIEAGGKDALIVAADADLDAAARAAVFGGLGNAGQTCGGVERVYVVDSVYDDFLGRLAALAAHVAPGAEETARYGPMTTPTQADVVRGHIADALGRGARAVVGGVDSVRPPYVEPVVLTDVPEDSTAVTEETFGPTLVVNRVADLDEAVRRANASRFGLAASVFSRDGRRALEVAGRLRTGAVSVNGVLGFAAIPALPFGGVGDSGFGRIHGADGLREFSRPHAVTRQRFRAPIDLMTLDRKPAAMSRAVKLFALRHGR